jgi:hypothetical protein
VPSLQEYSNAFQQCSNGGAWLETGTKGWKSGTSMWNWEIMVLLVYPGSSAVICTPLVVTLKCQKIFKFLLYSAQHQDTEISKNTTFIDKV